MSILHWKDPSPTGPSSGTRKFLARWTIFDLGIGLYVVSFFLPAVDGFEKLSGAACAIMSVFALRGDNGISELAFAGFLINPLTITYIVLRIVDRAPKARTYLAAVILMCLPYTWLSLVMMHMRIRIGHLVWVAALFLVIDWTGFRKRRV